MHTQATDRVVVNKDGNVVDEQVLRDGHRLSVTMLMMDSVKRPITTPMIFDAARHRPGSLPVTDADRQRRQEQQSKSDAALSARWKTAPPTAAVEAVQVEQVRTPTPAPGIDAAYRRRDQALEQRWKGGAA